MFLHIVKYENKYKWKLFKIDQWNFISRNSVWSRFVKKEGVNQSWVSTNFLEYEYFKYFAQLWCGCKWIGLIYAWVAPINLPFMFTNPPTPSSYIKFPSHYIDSTWKDSLTFTGLTNYATRDIKMYRLADTWDQEF